jgi:hypothetical protein
MRCRAGALLARGISTGAFPGRPVGTAGRRREREACHLLLADDGTGFEGNLWRCLATAFSMRRKAMLARSRSSNSELEPSGRSRESSLLGESQS